MEISRSRTENAAEQKDLKSVTVSRAQFHLSRRIEEADLIFAIRKDLLDTALLDLEALGGSQVGGHLQLGGHRAQQETGPRGMGFASDASIFEGGPGAQLGIQVLDHECDGLWIAHGGSVEWEGGRVKIECEREEAFKLRVACGRLETAHVEEDACMSRDLCF